MSGSSRSPSRSSSSNGERDVPVLHGEKVIFCQDDDLSPSLQAFDRHTGKPLWTDDRLDQAVNYSHPVINTVDGKDELVVAGTGMLLGYDPATGERTLEGSHAPAEHQDDPVVQDGVVYVSVQSSGIANQWIVAIDQATTGNRDGQVDRAEIQAYVGDKPIRRPSSTGPSRGDLNKDGFLKGEELDVAFMDPDNFAGKRHAGSARCRGAVHRGGSRRRPRRRHGDPGPLAASDQAHGPRRLPLLSQGRLL